MLIFSCYYNNIMRKIEKVLICGIGAVGSIYADKIQSYNPDNLKILVDKNRLKRYSDNPIIFNGKELNFNYILPDNMDFKADLIIIATKFDGLKAATENIKNFVKDDTIIMSLLNGVTSETVLAEKYGWDKLVLSYFIGHSAMRTGRVVSQDGIGQIVFGGKNGHDENEACVKEFFDRLNIKYTVPEDMEHALWRKFMLNVSTNQPSAILNMTFGQMQRNEKFIEFSQKLMHEVQTAAKAEGVKNTETMIDEAMVDFNKMVENGKTSTLQDVLSHKKTEVDMFAGTMIEFGKKHGFATPYNQLMKEMIEIIHHNY